eukprot:TRINITY_DN3478_c0_g2_i2.p1 TRINITY_DN3478_c0_g2~~TRINITY_DN3478_c0_g2_i2.p1  ORF type:complete len:567 (-),score=155.55 TRINITY_DN3478_c0_g2_i2:97-1797(-)
MMSVQVLLKSVVASTLIAGSSGNFLALDEAKSRARGHAISKTEISMSLNSSIDSVLGSQDGTDGERIAAIEASVWRTFQSLPKNDLGRLAPRSVRYLVHNYFSKEHGWLLEGLESNAIQASASEMHSANILQEKAPLLVEALLEDRAHGRGLNFEDIVMMIAALEKLIFNESVQTLSHAYTLNKLDPTHELNHAGVQEVLQSYLLLFRQGESANYSDSDFHLDYKAKVRALSPAWQDFVDYAQDAWLNSEYAARQTRNPFHAEWHSFEAVAEVVQDLAHNYGKWQNGDCMAMKEHLMQMSPDNSGRVPLDRFYKEEHGALYHFHESVDYLKSIGALESGHGRTPQVRIANYVYGPTNCIARSAYYSVCCLNECEAVMNHLEGQVQAPVASPEQLLRLTEDLASSSVDAPRLLSDTLRSKLHAIAERSGGAVPLHGRLFKQWLHYAYPNECAYPAQDLSAAAQSPATWKDGKSRASAEDKDQHIAEAVSYEDLAAPLEHWSDDEELFVLEDEPLTLRAAVKNAFTFGVRLAPILAILRGAYSAILTAKRVHSGQPLDYQKEQLGLLV